MGGHTPEPLFPFSVHYLSERVEAADKRPVGMDAASFCAEENTASIRFDTQDGPSFFGILGVKLRAGQAEVPGEAQSFIGRDPDNFAIATSAADLAFEGKRGLPPEVKRQGCGSASVVHRAASSRTVMTSRRECFAAARWFLGRT